jgi:hypothetical protein
MVPMWLPEVVPETLFEEEMFERYHLGQGAYEKRVQAGSCSVCAVAGPAAHIGHRMERV